MKISTKLLLGFILLLVLTNCSSDDSGINTDSEVDSPAPDPNTDSNSSSSVALDLEGLENLNLQNLTAFSSSGNATIDAEGNFDNLADQENLEAPVIFSNDEDEIVLGYFPQTVAEDQITLDDIVYFFVKTYPRVAIRDFDDNFLMTSLKESDAYPTLKNLLKTSLDQNISVINNPEFDVNVRVFLEQLEESNSASGKDIVAQFKVDYQRDGTIAIPTEAPIFSSFGVQITNQNGTPVYGPKLLNSKELVLSPGSFVNWLITEIFEEPDVGTENFTLNQDGVYTLYFTNGKGDAVLDELVINQNKRNFTTLILSYIFPIGSKNWIKDRKCDNVLFDVIGDIEKVFADAYFSDLSISPEQAFILIKDILTRSGEFAACIATETLKQKYWQLLFQLISKRLEAAEDISELLFQIRDFDGSDIRIVETRYFDNNISYGSLQFTNLTDAIEQESGTSFTFEGLTEEEEILYDVDRGALSSQFLPKVEWKGAQGIPFGFDLTGDAQIEGNSSVFFTDEIGLLQLSGTMGNEPSELTISPVIANLGEIPEQIIIPLTPSLDITGIWNLNIEDECYATDGTAWSSTGSFNGPIEINPDGTFIIIGEGANETMDGITDAVYTFINNVLTMNFTVSEEICPGVVIVSNEKIIVEYNSTDGSFSGTFEASIPGSTEPDCNKPPENCEGTATLVR